jgi:hypothetical protein
MQSNHDSADNVNLKLSPLQTEMLKLIELLSKTSKLSGLSYNPWMPDGPKPSTELLSALQKPNYSEKLLKPYTTPLKKQYYYNADFDGDEMKSNAPIKGSSLKLQSKPKKVNPKPYSDYKLIKNPYLHKMKAEDTPQEPKTFTPIVPLVVDSWGYKPPSYYHTGGITKESSIVYSNFKHSTIDKLYVEWYGVYDKFCDSMPDCLFTKNKKPPEPYLMLTEGQSAMTELPNWELHAQSVLKRQRKFKKLKKQRTDNRHYNLGTHPTQSLQQINHNRQQGHNKTQFCSRR